MLIKSKRIIVAGFCSFSLAMVSASVFGADSGKTNVMIGGQSAKLSTYYRSELNSDDHGFAKTDDNKPVKTTNISLNELKLGLDGQLTKESDYSVLLDLNFSAKARMAGATVNPESLIEVAQFNWWFTDMVGLGGGKMLINQGGWDAKRIDYSFLMSSAYTDGDMPFAGDAPAYALMVKAGGAGTVTVQLTDDVTNCPDAAAAKGKCSQARNAGARFNDENKQPAWNFEYAGDFGGIKPLLQYGSYDINHSKYFVLGFGYEGMGLEAYLDFIQDSVSYKGGADKKYTDTHSAYTLDVAYTIPKVARPFLKYSAFNVKQATDADVAKMATETKVNSAAGAFDDNNTSWALGSSFLMEGNHFRPYFALVNKSGKYAKSTTDDTAESKSDMQIKLGVMGNF